MASSPGAHGTFVRVQRACQICERTIAVEAGRIVPHGHRRDIDGFASIPCYGSESAPYDQSRAALPGYVIALETELAETIAALRKAHAGEASIPNPAAAAGKGRRLPSPARLVRGMPDYERRLRAWILELEIKAVAVEQELARARRRHAEWPGVSSALTGAP